MPRAWRILRADHVSEAFDGIGARRYPGRWNQKGVPVVYTGESLALATLEMLVHLEDWQMLEEYICIPVDFTDDLVQILKSEALPADWQDNPVPPSTRALGAEWAKDQQSVLLKVPSAIIPAESNYLINPTHPDFEKLIIGEPVPCNFDPRLRS